MIAGHETGFPGCGPDLEEVDGEGGVFVLFGVGDAGAAGGELDVWIVG